MSSVNTPKVCERCGHLLVYYETLGRSFCPDCDKEQIDELIKWKEKAISRKRTPKTDKNAA